jgi:hypothetical protein
VRPGTVSHFRRRRSPAGTPRARLRGRASLRAVRGLRRGPRRLASLLRALQTAVLPESPCARAPFPLVAGRSLRCSQAAARCLLRCRCSLLAAAACFHADEWTRTTQPASHAPICCLLASTRTSGRGRHSQSATRPSAAAARLLSFFQPATIDQLSRFLPVTCS